ncbi:MAG: hypothetical protein AAGD14_09455 [Planctomycetota bacterium]
MDRVTFEKQLEHFSVATVEFARRYVRDHLGSSLVYRVVPNQSCDDDHDPREVVYPEDELPRGDAHGPWTAAQVVEFLWRDGRVPAWVDLSVCVAEGDQVVLDLRCCGRYTDDPELIYYKFRDGPTPFSVHSPRFPPGWKEGDPRFHL